MRTVRVRKIGVGSFAKVTAYYFAAIGFVTGVVSTISVATQVIDKSDSFIAATGASIVVLGFGVILFPFFMFCIGWVQGLIFGWFFNLIFVESGGLELTIEEQDRK